MVADVWRPKGDGRRSQTHGQVRAETGLGGPPIEEVDHDVNAPGLAMQSFNSLSQRNFYFWKIGGAVNT